MIFVTADSCRPQLERLTKLLVSSFPGSTIYQHGDFMGVTHDVLNNKIDVVFLEDRMEKTSGLDFMRMLRRQKPDLTVFILAKTEAFREEAEEAGADGCFVLPDHEQQLVDAVRSVKNKEKVS